MPQSDLQKVLATRENLLKIPRPGDLIKGKIFQIAKSEIMVDIESWTVGIIRLSEFYDVKEYENLKIGDEIEAVVIELENERGEAELSLRYAGQERAWAELEYFQKENQLVTALVIDANRGGLIVKINETVGFLPLSHLGPGHYPRVPESDKTKILEKLKMLIGQELEIKIIELNKSQELLVVSEKEAMHQKQLQLISDYQIGQVVEGTITIITDFGIFIRFEGLEGLIHISEVAWKKVDDLKEIFRIGQKIKAKIIGFEGSKIFLSLKRLFPDPWQKIDEKYQVEQKVKGKIIKVNPFGLFVELDENIHGLCHISELSDRPLDDPSSLFKIGELLEFNIISIDPLEHRLGLSRKGL